jgi:hypothetical protein
VTQARVCHSILICCEQRGPRALRSPEGTLPAGAFNPAVVSGQQRTDLDMRLIRSAAVFGSYRVWMIGTLDVVVLDCPEPQALARFYVELIGGEIAGSDSDWAEIVAPHAGGRPLLAFQRVDQYQALEWPGQRIPQQIHLDVKVEDLDLAEEAALALGATATGAGTDTFRVYLDPAGHPFCLIHPED